MQLLSRADDMPEITPFKEKLRHSGISLLKSRNIEVLQINVGLRCNLLCKHCHASAGPHHTETMSLPTLEKCLVIASGPSITTVDITGGAPEMNENLEWFLTGAANLKKRLIVRTNAVLLLEDAFSHHIDLYARTGVELAVSLPDAKKEKCDRQRGPGSFDTIVRALKLLNARGYGAEGSGLILDLVHNPIGAFLPGSQDALEKEYKTRLAAEHGICFNRLFCLTNNPSGRFRDYLLKSENYGEYMRLLERAYNSDAAKNVMCRTMLSVGWDGALYDCDFNQMLGLKVDHGAPRHVDQFDTEILQQREIVIDNHCYACTAGQGSSCQGAVRNG
jgi:radical SAM/Cys-rich protein